MTTTNRPVKNRVKGSALALAAVGMAGLLLCAAERAEAAPQVRRLTPPSTLFTIGDPNPPYIARFLPGQRFDLQSTVSPDAGQTMVDAEFWVDGKKVPGTVSMTAATVAGLPAGTAVFTLRAYSSMKHGVHILTIKARQSDGLIATADGNFEVVKLGDDERSEGDRGRAKNIIFMIGDGMGIAHRTAARVMLRGAFMGKSRGPLAMDTFPNTALITTHSLNSIVTDSAPGASCYSAGNKSNNGQQGVFPDDTTDNFDNPRVELIGEYLARTEGRSLGIVTTADVFDATPGAFGSHTANRGAGTGICDQYLDEMVVHANLRVLMGGGRKWFLPQGTIGSARTAALDYVLPGELAAGWGVAAGAIDPARNLLGDFITAGFSYASNKTEMNAAAGDRLLGLFTFSNMNVALDKIGKRRGTSTIVDDYGFPDQPMLDEMTDKALQVLSTNPRGFFLMVEGASIDKQAHNMDSDRWILEAIEFDRSIAVAKEFARTHHGTLVVVTADHECGGVNIIGASTVPNSSLVTRAASGGGAAQLRAGVVGTYDAAGFPVYTIDPDGYPHTTDPDFKMLIGYAANADRYEDWLTNPQPLKDSQQPLIGLPPLSTYPALPVNRDVAGNFLVTGQVADTTAVHTASDIPLSAYGSGGSLFKGVLDNTDVFFKVMQAAQARNDWGHW